MSTILVEDLKEESMARLRARAATHGKSLQSELQLILETAATAVDQQPLRGRSGTLPVPKDEEAELDSVGKLEQYMSTCWPNVQGLIKPQPGPDADAPLRQPRAEPKSRLRARDRERQPVGV
jgi:hypothetical protein